MVACADPDRPVGGWSVCSARKAPGVVAGPQLTCSRAFTDNDIWLRGRGLEDAGCFALVLEKIPAALCQRVCQELTIPVIGIGAGPADGQVLVIHDMLGMNQGFSPKFLRRYADLNTVITEAVQNYIDDVKSCDFPSEKEQY